LVEWPSREVEGISDESRRFSDVVGCDRAIVLAPRGIGRAERRAMFRVNRVCLEPRQLCPYHRCASENE
jgi:hypothetical protein